MAKQDYPKDVGMWAVQPDAGAGTKDTLLNTLIPHFEKVWDGHSSPIHRACNILMSYGDKTAWGWLGQGDLETRAEAHAYAFGEWILRIKKANASAGGLARLVTSLVLSSEGCGICFLFRRRMRLSGVHARSRIWHLFSWITLLALELPCPKKITFQ